jgi:LIM domain kinase 1
LGELIGSGFFGRVFRVTHRETNQVYVLKELYRVDEEAQNNFIKEVINFLTLLLIQFLTCSFIFLCRLQ